MDLAKVGKFIKDCRKDKKLTQLQLSIKIGVSEKTVSKWECGNGFPDASLMLALCDALEISANELLSGKRLSEDKEYRQEADNNIVYLKKEQEKTAKFLLGLEYIIAILSIIVLLTFVLMASYVVMPTYLRVVLIIVGAIISLVGIHFCLIIEKDAGFYECKHCHYKYVPTYKQVLWSMHCGRTRHMKCPKCNRKSWQKKSISGDNSK